MSLLLARMARTITQHWVRSLFAAIAVIVLLGFAAGAGGEAADDFSIPGTESQEAIDLFKAHTPALAGADSTLVFTVEDGKVTDAAHKQAIESALDKVKGLDGVAQVGDPFAEGGAVSEDGTLAAVDVRYEGEPGDLEKADGEALLAAAETAEQGGVEVNARGVLIDLASEQEAPVGELIGVGIAIILLTVLFRSLAAMAATLIGALIGVMVGQILIAALAKPLGLPSFAAVIAVMLGLGAGIDYALLIIGRYREQVAAGDSVRDASAKALATSGASVVAAGLIVMVAIAGLLVIGIPLIGKLGVGAAIGVAGVVVSALTILPIMIGALKRWLKPKKPEHVRPSPGFERWATFITARPWTAIIAGVAILLVFAVPVTSLRLGQPDDGNQPESRTQRAAYDKLSEAFGPGSNGPFLLAVDIPKGAAENEQQLTDAPERRRRHARRRERHAGAAERGRRDGHHRRRPRDRAAGQAHQRPARAPARGRDPAGHRGHAAEGLRRRQHARLRGLLRQGRGGPAAVHRGRHRPERPAPDGRLPLALDPARLGASSTCCPSAPPTAWSRRSSRRASARA